MTAAAFLKKRDSWLRAVVEDGNLSHSAVRVAVHIALRMNGAKQSGAWPSIRTIAKATSVSQRTVNYALNELAGLDAETGEVAGTPYLT